MPCLVQNNWHPCQLSQHTATERKKHPSRHTSLNRLPRCPGCWAPDLANSGHAGMSSLEARCSEASLGSAAFVGDSQIPHCESGSTGRGKDRGRVCPQPTRCISKVWGYRFQLGRRDGCKWGSVPKGSKISDQLGLRVGVSVFPTAQMASRLSLGPQLGPVAKVTTSGVNHKQN